MSKIESFFHVNKYFSSISEDMEELREIDKKRFPLKTISDIVGLFEDQLNSDTKPNLALLSIVLGVVEHSLTVNKPLEKRPRGRPNHKININEADGNLNGFLSENIPVVELDDVKLLFELFVKLIKANVDLSQYELKKYTPTALLKKVSDILWNTLSRTFYKDKGHLQFLYTLFNEQKMDCIGMAFGVVCGCQVLGLQDVHLAVTEDHVWAVYGKNGSLTSEITWHGKGTEDRRGHPVTSTAPEKSWLYESPMICNRYTEVATLVAGINPIINSTSESLEMAIIQKRLLWCLYDRKHLDKYPLALGVLADLEEIHPSTDGGRPSSFKLYKKAIEMSRMHYDNSHIYPHTYLGNYYYRRRKYKEALRSWANAAQVASRFNYNREDDEIYREFNEIANEIMPNIIKTCCAIQDGLLTSNNPNVLEADDKHDKTEPVSCDHSSERKLEEPLTKRKSRQSDSASLLSDTECYADVLRFFDGICEWEEGSSMPVLHIIWAKNMSYTISKFFPIVRSSLKISVSNENEEKQSKNDSTDRNSCNPVERSSKKKQRGKDSNESTGEDQSITTSKDLEPKASEPENKDGDQIDFSQGKIETSNELEPMEDDMDREGSDNNNTDIIIAQISFEPQDMDTESGGYSVDDLKALDKNDLDLKHSEKRAQDSNPSGNVKNVDNPTSQNPEDVISKKPEPADETQNIETSTEKEKKCDPTKSVEDNEVRLLLRSQKMASMKDLLNCERLNLSAIKLLLTAQSQVNAKPTILPSSRGVSEGTTTNQPQRKRARNE